MSSLLLNDHAFDELLNPTITRFKLHDIQEDDTSSSSEASYTPLEDTEDETRIYFRERYTPRNIVHCTPEVAFGPQMQEYIASQIRTPKKRWIYDVISGNRESDERLLENNDIILIPDIDGNTDTTHNWLAVFKDTSLRTIRDLTGKHVEMLEKVRDNCVKHMQEITGVQKSQIMCYFHYLPSVFQLHLHVCAPYGQYTTPDIYKIHPIDTIISNLRIDNEYYKKAVITTVVIGRGDLHRIYRT